MKTTYKNQNGFTVIEILIVVAILGVVSFIGVRVMDSRRNNTDATKQLNNQFVLPENLAGIKTIDEIITLAASEIATRQVLAAELEQEDEGLVYSIKLNDGTVLVYDAKTGSKVQLKAPGTLEMDDDTPLPVGFKPVVTLEAVIQTAKTQRPGKIVEKLELEVEDSIAVYSVRFSDEGRVDVDATTGSVLRIREPGQPDVKLKDDDNDIDDDDQDNGADTDDDNDGIKDGDNDNKNDDKDDDNENDGVVNKVDDDDDNDGIEDSDDGDDDEDDDDDSGNSGRN